MSRVIFILLTVFASLSLFSQDDDSEKIMTNESFVLDIGHLTWLSPPEGMEVKPNSTNIGFYMMGPLIGKRYNISLATGFGFVAQNLKSNFVPVYNPDETITMNSIPEEIDYQKNKFTNVYVDMPFELRIRTTPNRKLKNFKIMLGGLVGYRLQSYHKYQGEDYNFHNYGDYVKYKEYRIKNVLPYRYGVYGRIGYGKFCLYAYYSLSSVFEKNKGPEVTPVTFGITITPVYSKNYYYKEYRKRILSEN